MEQICTMFAAWKNILKKTRENSLNVFCQIQNKVENQSEEAYDFIWDNLKKLGETSWHFASKRNP